MYQWGAAIRLHENMQQHIHQVIRVDHRILKVIPKADKASIPITIITSYAPRKGYKHDIRYKHWQELDQTIAETPQNHLCIWRADASGQIGNRKTSPELTKIVSMNTMAENAEKGNGKALQKLCVQYNMTPVNTWRRNTGQTKHDPIETTIWISPDGK